MRDNEKRLGAASGPAVQSDAAATAQAAAPAAQPQGLSFVVPTDFVELPSQGKFYPSDHPLHNQEVVEIKHMTAKEEDILTSSSLLKKGIALERLLANIILDKRIDPDTLLSGDRNAILVSARQSGYGTMYETRVACPQCTSVSKHTFDLDEKTINSGCLDEEVLRKHKARLEDNIIYITLPKTKVVAGLKLMTGVDENKLADISKKRKDGQESAVTDQLSRIIVSLNDVNDAFEIYRFVESMPIVDSKHLRKVYGELVPNIDLTQGFGCMDCGHFGDMEVPFNTEFFWPE
tara:strand:+ start:1363 stop:2235 length:873 start_codon:yes stop_codon:yes gene_type:complete